MSTDQPIRPGRDRRRGARFISADPQFNSTLIVGRREFPARILDESAGGFCISIEKDPRVEVDAIVRLRTAMTCYEVRVASVGRDEENSPESVWRLGLQCLRELEVTLLPSDKTPWRIMTQHLMPGGSMLGAILFIVILLVAAPLTAVGVMYGLDEGSLEQFTQWTGFTGSQVRGKNASDTSWRFLPFAASPREATEHAAKAPSTSSSDPLRLPNAASIRTILDHTPGAEALLLPEVATHLALSASQQQQLGKLVDATNQALAQSSQYTQDSRHQRARKRELLFREARKQALQVLTAEQHARWEALQTP